MFTGFGVGGALLVTGTVMWIMAAADTPTEEKKTAFGIVPLEGGLGVTIGGRW